MEDKIKPPTCRHGQTSLFNETQSIPVIAHTASLRSRPSPYDRHDRTIHEPRNQGAEEQRVYSTAIDFSVRRRGSNVRSEGKLRADASGSGEMWEAEAVDRGCEVGYWKRRLMLGFREVHVKSCQRHVKMRDDEWRVALWERMIQYVSIH